jgi:hypothetical protein
MCFVISPYMQLIFIKSIEEHNVPKDWLVANVTALFKKGDKSQWLLSRFLAMSSVVMTSCDSHDRLFLKPCWKSTSMLCLSRWFIICTQREQQVTIEGDKSSTAKVTSGVPQGTVQGPLMFLLYNLMLLFLMFVNLCYSQSLLFSIL